MKEIFKIELSFLSLIKISSVIGFSAGVVAIPFYMYTFATGMGFDIALLQLIFMGPVVGMINGALLGFLAYPFYWWFSKKVGVKYSGYFYPVSDKNA
ncbi:hypothetical protein [Simiduia aestuariiviva]|uniref:Ribose/xylose/arabinose/galactoside ABC-type transport system permease subunit n=1 Tax=Simiduia aestuariiviva TaxID=1510459 RepID=A0A839UND8_9GAMM|nr:hypothetical protein [Simiduia aestuariiviva]MBB3167088.1 ribose/xylose/arabinose/galactoside ABC-type transport system permease subunit [Simiduia aestuariiviva]